MLSWSSFQNKLCCQNLKKTEQNRNTVIHPRRGKKEVFSVLEYVLVYDYIPLPALRLLPQRELQSQVLA